MVLGPEKPPSRTGRQIAPASGGVMTFARARETLSAPDYGLMRRVNRWRAPRWIRVWMLFVTRAGDGWLWAAIAIALLFSGDPLRFHAAEAGCGAVAAGILIFHRIKRAVGRTRPRDIEPHCWACIVTRD